MIGEHIFYELTEAELIGLPFSWRQDGSLDLSDDRLTTEQRAAITAVFNAHDPGRVPSKKIKASIDKQRDLKLAEGVLWNGRRWQIDDVMRSALQWRITRWQLGRLAADATLPVRAMDNTIQMLGRDDHLALAEAIEAYGAQIYAESWAAKDAL